MSRDGSVESAIGLTHHLQGDVNKAIEYYHKALSFKCDDTLITEMLIKSLSHEQNKD